MVPRSVCPKVKAVAPAKMILTNRTMSTVEMTSNGCFITNPRSRSIPILTKKKLVKVSLKGRS
jgi:hypothetical protein